ncbi:hypothetical protein DVG78_05950 [Runella aurantiaca]|uniref:histidine kinase n=2 Tax=Runella aurantiaca TaxID=2282308 RepID=A0A369IB15_9BACT|nr:hypothetical protein DVG78_05950 [Runella aurantiaca]
MGNWLKLSVRKLYLLCWLPSSAKAAMKNFSILYFIAFTGFAQKPSQIDSLKKILAATSDIQRKTKIVQDICEAYSRNQPDSAKKYLEIAQDFSKKSMDKKLEGRSYHLAANFFRAQNEFEKSLQASQKTIDLYEAIDYKRGLGRVYNSIGLTYKKMGDSQKVAAFTRKALMFSLKAIDMAKVVEDTNGLISGYNNAGIAYRDLKEFRKAEDAYKLGLKNAEKYKVDRDAGVLHANLGQIYIDFEKEYDKAIIELEKSLVIHANHNDQQGIEHAYRSLGKAFQMKKEYKKAIAYAQKSVAIAHSLKDIHRLFNAYGILYGIQEDAGLYKEALASLKIAKQLEDSTLRVDKTKNIAEIESKYQTEKKELEIKSLNEKNALQRNQLAFAGLGLLVLMGLLGTLYWQYKKIKENRSQIQKQSDDLKLMMKELHHRVKNNLAIVSSLLKIQSSKMEDEKAVLAVRQGQQRVEAMSLIHQRLYQNDKVSTINIKEYISDLVDSLMNAYGHEVDNFEVQLSVEQEEMDVDLAISLGLIINELITNSFKYAYAEAAHPTLKITLKNKVGLSLEIQDNGPGLDMERWNRAKDSFGKKLISGLTKQIGGSFTIENQNGTYCRLYISPEKMKLVA